uniref:Uncharacterized protein n=1 Tax=Arundo donax TaxID=35708 RepID=A0A0A9BS01_ARUDO
MYTYCTFHVDDIYFPRRAKFHLRQLSY